MPKNALKSKIFKKGKVKITILYSALSESHFLLKNL